MTFANEGMLDLGDQQLEYRLIGSQPSEAPCIVMLHEGLGSVGLWGEFPQRLAEATGAGVFLYSRAGYGQSSPAKLPRPVSFMHHEARDVLPRVLDKIGFRRGLLFGHSDGASIAAIYAGSRSGSSRARADPHGATLLHGGHGDCRDRAGAGGLRDGRFARQARALARGCGQRLSRLERHRLNPEFLRGTSPRTLPTSACRSSSCRARTTNTARCGSWSWPRRNAIARWRWRCCPAPGTPRTARRRSRRCRRQPGLQTGCCTTIMKAR